MDAKYWSTSQTASYWGVSTSWLRHKIKEGTIAAIKAGPFQWPRGECYCIKRREVMRVLREVPVPPTEETLADRLEQGRDRPYRDTGMDSRSEVNRFLRLLPGAAPTSPRLAQSLCGESLRHLGSVGAFSTLRKCAGDLQSVTHGTLGQLPRIASHNGYSCCRVSHSSDRSIGNSPFAYLLGVVFNPYSM
jgi:hypothetical protein